MASYQDIDRMLYHQGLLFVPKVIWMEFISRHYNNLLAGHFGIKKICELLARKDFWQTLRHNIEAYVKGCNVCLASKAMRHKPYGNFQFLLVPTHCWKDLSINFMTGLPILVDWKRDSYDSILVIIDRVTKIVYYKLVKIIINAPGLAEVIINVVVWHHGLLDSIVTNRTSVFTPKFWLLLCYFLGIKRHLSTAFYPQTNRQTKRQNSTIEAYLRAFVNFEQNDWVKFLPMAKFAYNNAKNASTSYTSFDLNCEYYPYVSYKEDIDPCSKSKLTDELSAKLQKVMIVCQENIYHTQKL